MKVNKENILGLFRENPAAPIQFRTIMQIVGVTKAGRAKLKAFMEKLVSDGELISMKGNRYGVSTPGEVLTGRLTTHRDGYGFVTLDGGGEDLFIPARYLRENLHGDRVEVRIASIKRDGKKEGRIIRTIEKGQFKIVGRYVQGQGCGRVIPDENRITHEIIIPPKASGHAKNGQIVVAEVVTYPSLHQSPEGRVIEVLGWPDQSDVEVLTIIRKHGLYDHFPEDAIASAGKVPDQITPDDLKGRVDLREKITVTIDGETARDFDDAVSVRQEGRGSIRLWVSIADVSNYVLPGSSLDREAYLRGTSVYFPDRCIPMLPEELSNGICSLNPGVDRLTLSAEMLFDKSGALKESTFFPSIIRSSARLTYTAVKKILVDEDSQMSIKYAALVDDLKLMEKLAERLSIRRKKRGSIDFDLPEPEIVINLQGETLDIVRAERNLAHRIIEEFMLAANEAVSTFLEKKGIPSLFRVHEPPDPMKVNDFREFIHNFGYDFKMNGEKITSNEFQWLLEQAEGRPEERMINEVLLRCMKQARYNADNLGHFGLASPCYTHFTSPIRRYPDLVVHRILKKTIKGTLKEHDIERLESTLPEIAGHSSRMERIAMDAEREIVELKKIQFIQDKVGEEFDGFITGIINYGFFVELVDYFVEGMVHVTMLPHDYYQYLEKQHALVGEHTRAVFRIGDRVRVRIANVSLEKKQIDFVLSKTSSNGVEIAQNEEYPRIPVTGKRPAKGKESGGKRTTPKKGRRRG